MNATITSTHSDAAYDWYNSADRTKADFERYAETHGVVLFGDNRTYPDFDWADVVMSLFDATAGTRKDETTMAYTNDDIRNWLAAQHGVEAECVKNGSEASETEAGDYHDEPNSWLVLGTMPNTNECGWFFAGYAGEIEKDMDNYDCRPQ